jgi:hypothetical protein
MAIRKKKKGTGQTSHPRLVQREVQHSIIRRDRKRLRGGREGNGAIYGEPLLASNCLGDLGDGARQVPGELIRHLKVGSTQSLQRHEVLAQVGVHGSTKGPKTAVECSTRLAQRRAGYQQTRTRCRGRVNHHGGR